ncbi:MAG: tRNA 5-methylaminomethyl-2-thiouridine biosynthesis bifunctional protein MnmC [Hyphomicrobiaceae bacterium hypho_1]
MKKKCYDLCIVGGGVVGLWIARHLIGSGLKIAIVEQNSCGSGASGGVLGALTAHSPENWNKKKQFQLDALKELPEIISILEEETGCSTGYERCGRLIPIRRKSFLARSEQRSHLAEKHWFYYDTKFTFNVYKSDTDRQIYKDWLAPECAPLGHVLDTLAARIQPRLYTATLKASLLASHEIDVLENWAFGHFDESCHIVYSTDGIKSLVAKEIVLAAGYQTFTILKPVLKNVIGTGIKGQAAVFACPNCDGMPLIYDDGVYIVPHNNGTCAVGSTTEKNWSNATLPNEQNSDFIARAKTLCVPLSSSQIIERWAGVRPRCNLTDPIIGRLGNSSISVATGGYKITFGIAHRIAKYIANDICGVIQNIDLPLMFRPEHHIHG